MWIIKFKILSFLLSIVLEQPEENLTDISRILTRTSMPDF